MDGGENFLVGCLGTIIINLIVIGVVYLIVESFNLSCFSLIIFGIFFALLIIIFFEWIASL
ncbi:hypothetical protein SPSF3K_00077 [Streptococcus parauberis]|uniref:Uncharacterized protein n=1 Tax=Streptococcus parauberis KRS-02083 TaxID=1207545 RepID=A0ABN0IP48_9STRE|nr:hypothetical protein [Streptococcus parauberis]AUT04819.1 hypothetical protein SPSF3K_00077 [Streptococcus parauberis]EMG24567.1 hypothetical protein SPJ1_2088 [Streptococcus parauberis KRS-02083]QBX09816.1 hypothetical protein JavanS390_0005 [Streptococcus satellite phage Javan390]QBX09860.1 hypothetical protein JavanS395_0005 [Streptococcus satellite phage Javan395]